MNTALKYLFSVKYPREGIVDAALMAFRIMIAFALFRTHGLKKIADFESTLMHIPDPFGIGGLASTCVAIFVNVGLAGFVALGFLTRLSAVGILSLTLSGLFLVHFNDPWPVKDVPLIYSIAYTLVLFLGPGTYSMDHLISEKLKK